MLKMASLSFYEIIISDLLEACGITSNAEKSLPKSTIGPLLLHHLSPTTLKKDPGCQLILRLTGFNKETAASNNFSWSSSYHPVSIELSESPACLTVPDSNEHSQLILYDLCRFVFNCLKKCEIPEIKISCDLSTAKNLLGHEKQQVSKNFLTGAFLFTHLIRVPGEQQITVSEDSGGALTVQIGNRPPCPLRSLSYSCSAETDSKFEKDLFEALIASLGPIYMCLLFNELETCNWYLRVKGKDRQHDRLPNHDTSLIEIQGDGRRLKIRVTAFDSNEDKYSDLIMELDGTKNFSPTRFKDDELLLCLVNLVQKFLTESKINSVWLFFLTVPCRTTLKWLELTSCASYETSRCKTDPQEASTSDYQGAENVEFLTVTYHLCQSAALGNIKKLNEMLNLDLQSVHLKQQDFPHRSALLCAAAASTDGFSQATSSHTQCFQTLILKGADVGDQDSRGHSVLHCAVLSNNGDLVDWLLQESSADPSCRDKEGQTPLALAVEEENLCIAKVFLENGAKLSVEPGGTYLELTRAIGLENVELVELLLDYQPDAVSDAQFHKYYWKAWKLDATEICCLLLLRKYGLAEDAVEEAAQLGDLASQGCAEQLEKQLNIRNCNFRDWDCRTPLMWAAIGSCNPTQGHAECAKLLLSLGADHITSDLDGNSALHLAAASGSLSVSRLLLQHGASVQAVNRKGDKSVDVAEQRGHLDVGVILRRAETCPMIAGSSQSSATALHEFDLDFDDKTDRKKRKFEMPSESLNYEPPRKSSTKSMEISKERPGHLTEPPARSD